MEEYANNSNFLIGYFSIFNNTKHLHAQMCGFACIFRLRKMKTCEGSTPGH